MALRLLIAWPASTGRLAKVEPTLDTLDAPVESVDPDGQFRQSDMQVGHGALEASHPRGQLIDLALDPVEPLVEPGETRSQEI